MKIFLVLRHAKSSWSKANLADHDRPLKKRGKRDAPKIGRVIRKEHLIPDLIISSTAKRAVQTAQIVGDVSGYTGEIQFTRSLYLAGTESYLEIAKELDRSYQTVMVVGHNPGIEELVEELTGDYERMPTGALAQVELAVENWSEIALEGTASLVNLWRPRHLEF